MDLNKLTIKTQEVLQAAQVLATEKGNQAIETAHVLKSILTKDKDVIPYLLKSLNVNIEILSNTTDKIIENYSKVTGGQMYMSSKMNEVLNNSYVEMKKFNDEYVSIEVLFYSLLGATDSIGTLLKDNKINQKNLKASIMELRRKCHYQ
jgi:ATP-dependent Clp protease ATP-binding subunit ClpB